MRDLKFNSFQIIETESSVTITAILNENTGFSDNEIKIIIESNIELITGIKTEIGRSRISYAKQDNLITASIKKQ